MYPVYYEPLAVYIKDDINVLIELRDRYTGLWRGYACLSGGIFLECLDIVYRLATDNTYSPYRDSIMPENPLCYLTKEGALIRRK